MALSAGIFFGGSASAFASTEFPVGDLREVQEIKEIEVEVDENSEEVEGNLLQPQALGATLTTGRHYQYLSADEKLLYAALYSAVMDKKYVPYSMRNSRSNSYLSSKLYPVYAGTTSLVNLYPSKNAFWYAVYRAAEACYYDHPNKIELYLVGATYCATYKASNGQTVTAIVYVAYGDDTKFASMDSQIDSRANSIVSAIKAVEKSLPPEIRLLEQEKRLKRKKENVKKPLLGRLQKDGDSLRKKIKLGTSLTL